MIFDESKEINEIIFFFWKKYCLICLLCDVDIVFILFLGMFLVF